MATGTDAQGQLFLLTFEVLDIEDKDNWLWFLTKVRKVLKQHISISINKPNALTFLSDCQKGLIDGVSNVFPLAAHGYCLKHLEKNLKATFKNKDLSTLLWKVAASKTPAEFTSHMENFCNISNAAYKWLLNHTDPAN